LAAELLVATRSTDKLEEIRAILAAAARVTLVTLTDLNLPPTSAEDAIESHPTFLGNAIAKARYFAGLTGMPTLADDSGLMVDELAGGPGVRTRRFAIDGGYVAADVSGRPLDSANNRLLLERLTGIPDERRRAHYVCAAAYANSDVIITSIGTCSGRIGNEEKGAGGFGYDPLFVIPELAITFAQLSREQKNQRSHRAIAFRALAPHIRKP
jgi:XTP/dITP diphosphohydrolase